MKKHEIAKQLARRSRVSQAEAADRLDVTVHKIVADLRNGLEVSLPGLGKLRHGADGQVAFEHHAKRAGGKKHV